MHYKQLIIATEILLEIKFLNYINDKTNMAKIFSSFQKWQKNELFLHGLKHGYLNSKVFAVKSYRIQRQRKWLNCC